MLSKEHQKDRRPHSQTSREKKSSLIKCLKNFFTKKAIYNSFNKIQEVVLSFSDTKTICKKYSIHNSLQSITDVTMGFNQTFI